MSEVHRFAVVGEGDPAALLEAVAERAGLERAGEVAARRTFLDTADGRLAAVGTTLELRAPVRGNEEPVLVWSADATGEVLATMTPPTGGPPRFAEDLPAGPAGARLARRIEMRALLPQVEVMSRLTTLAKRDEEGKTTVRVVLDDSTPLGSAVLPAVLEVVPVRGYDKAAAAVLDVVAAQVTLQPLEGSRASQARAALGARPYLSSKLRLTLDPQASAEDAWREVLTVLAATMADNLEGTIADTDSEFLHDFRVAVRRTRSVLQEGRRILPSAPRAHWRAELKWLGDITTPTRDADVHLLDFPVLAASLPPERAADLQPLHDLLVVHQRRSQAELAAALRSDRYTELSRAWSAALAARWPGTGPDACRPAAEVVAERLRRAWKQVIRDGRAIGEHSPPEALHDLRKDAKRLRYLLECFGSTLDVADVALVIKPLKGLQDVLGEFQDTEVQAAALADLGDELVQGGAPAATLLAMGRVVEHLHERGRQARVRFADRFAAFDDPATREVVRRLVRAPGGGA
jgi:CHAD domain-containing protein